MKRDVALEMAVVAQDLNHQVSVFGWHLERLNLGVEMSEVVRHVPNRLVAQGTRIPGRHEFLQATVMNHVSTLEHAAWDR